MILNQPTPVYMNFYSSSNPLNHKMACFGYKRQLLAKGQTEISVLLQQNPFFIY